MAFDNSFLGFDFNMDGKINMTDDVMFMMFMEDEEKTRRKNEQLGKTSSDDMEHDVKNGDI